MTPDHDQAANPAFGERLPGQAYTARPGAYAIIRDPAGRLLLVRVDGRYFLPGGGADPGESPEATVRREVLEECGLTVDELEWLGVVDQYLYAADERTYFHKRCTLFVATLTSAAPQPAEDGCELIWLAPNDAELCLAHESQAWAIRKYREHILHALEWGQG